MICLFVAILISYDSVSQEQSDDVGLISLAVVLPDNSDHLSQSQLSKIKSRIHKIVTLNGLSGSGYNNNFVIYPKFEIYDESVVEGMKNIIIVETEFNLFIKQVDNNMMFASYSKSIKGSGYSREKAINDAISKIATRDPKIQSFIEEGKEKIIDYYVKNCDKISKKADAFIQKQEFEQAIGLLMTVPEEVSECHEKIQQKSIKAYLAYQKQHCKEQMQQANMAFANNNYSDALYYLGQIDPSSPCNDDARKTMSAIGKKVDGEEKRDWDFMMKRHNDSVSLEKSRINAVKEIAKAYYSSQPQTVNYTTILR